MPSRRKKTVPPPPLSHAPGRRLSARRIVLIVTAVAVFAGILLSTGEWRDMTAGPRKPLPRLNLGLGFGTDLKDVKTRFPGCTDRSFNNDPQFRIITLKDRPDMPEGSSEAEIIFFEGKLFFTSSKWEGDAAARIPAEDWAHEYRRWKIKQPDSQVAVQGAESDTLLREWYFRDDATEMILRDLTFNGTVNRWLDLRDASNTRGQEAFRKYRFDLQ